MVIPSQDTHMGRVFQLQVPPQSSFIMAVSSRVTGSTSGWLPLEKHLTWNVRRVRTSVTFNILPCGNVALFCHQSHL